MSYLNNDGPSERVNATDTGETSFLSKVSSAFFYPDKFLFDSKDGKKGLATTTSEAFSNQLDNFKNTIDVQKNRAERGFNYKIGAISPTLGLLDLATSKLASNKDKKVEGPINQQLFNVASTGQEVYSLLGMVASPILGLIEYLGQDRANGLNGDNGGVMQTISSAQNMFGEYYNKGVNTITDTPFTKEEQKINKEFGGNLGLDIATAGLFKGGGVVLKGAKKAVPATLNKVLPKKSVEEIDAEILKQTQEFKAQGGLFQETKDASQLVKSLEDLNIGTQAGLYDNTHINYVQERFGLKDLSFFKRQVKEANKIETIQGKASGNLFNGFYKNQSPKLTDKIITKLKKINYFNAKNKKQATKILKSTGYSDGQIKSALETYNAYKNTNPVNVIENINKYQQLKKTDFESVKDTVNNTYKASMLKTLYDQGIVKIEKNTDFLHSFKFTSKGEKQLKLSNIPEDVQAKFIKDGFAELPKELWANITGKAIEEANIIKKQLIHGVELKELGRLNLERVSGKGGKTNSLDIYNTLQKIDQRYNLGLGKSIDDAFDVMGNVNHTKLDALINQVRHVDNFEKYKRIRVRPNEYKNLKQKLGYSQEVNNALFNEGKRLTEIELKSTIANIKRDFKNQKKQILLNKKIDRDVARGKLIELNDKWQQKLIALKAKAKKIDDVKAGIIDQFKSLSKNKYYLGNIKDIVFDNVIKKSGLLNAITEKQLNNAIENIYKNITSEYVKGLEGHIKELLDIKKVSKSTKKSIRTKYAQYEYTQLITAKQLFKNLDKGNIDIKALEQLIDDINYMKAIGSKKAENIRIKKAKSINQKVGKIIKEGIKDLKGYADIINKDKASGLTKVKGFTDSFLNKTKFIPRIIEDIFGRKGLAYNEFVRKPNRQLVKFNIAMDKTHKVVKLLIQSFGKEIEEFGAYMFTVNKVYGKKGVDYIGLKKIISDKTSFAHIKRKDTAKQFDELPADFPLTEAQWNTEVKPGLLLKNSKLGEILEKHGTPKYKRALDLVNSHNTLIGNQINKVLERLGEPPINLRENYMQFKVLDGSNPEMSAIFQDDRAFINYINDNFRHTATQKQGMVYDYNPLNTLVDGGRKQLYFIHMKETFDELQGLLRGSAKQLKLEDVKTIESKLSSGNYKLVNKRGEEVNYKGHNKEGFVITDEGLIEHTALYLKGKGGLVDNLNKEARKNIGEYLDVMAKGGFFPGTTTETIVQTVTQQANVAPLIGSISVVLKQALTGLDAFGVLGTKHMADGISDLISNPSILKELRKIDTIIERGDNAGNVVLAQMKPSKSAVSKGYHKFVDKATTPMRLLDREIYSTIWYSAYKKYMIKNNKAIKGRAITKFDDVRARDYADEMANKTAGTANPLYLPAVYRDVWTRGFFGLFTTQLNRFQQFRYGIKEHGLISTRGAEITAYFLASNAVEVGITYGVGKFLYTIGASNYDKYGQDIYSNIFSLNSLYRMTVGQTFLGSKLMDIKDFGITSASPILSLGDKVAKDLLNITNKPEGAVDALIRTFGGSIGLQIARASGLLK